MDIGTQQGRESDRLQRFNNIPLLHRNVSLLKHGSHPDHYHIVLVCIALWLPGWVDTEYLTFGALLAVILSI
jgi:hypothetical protein